VTTNPQPTNYGSSVQASTGTTTTARATISGRYQFGSNDDTLSVVIEGVSDVDDGIGDAGSYNGTVSDTIVDSETFTYTTNDSAVGGDDDADAPGQDLTTGTITARPAGLVEDLFAIKAFVTLTGHGYIYHW